MVKSRMTIQLSAIWPPVVWHSWREVLTCQDGNESTSSCDLSFLDLFQKTQKNYCKKVFFLLKISKFLFSFSSFEDLLKSLNYFPACFLGVDWINNRKILSKCRLSFTIFLIILTFSKHRRAGRDKVKSKRWIFILYF